MTQRLKPSAIASLFTPVILGVALLCLIYGFMTWQLLQSRKAGEHVAAVAASNLAQLLSERLYSGINNLDLAFDDVIYQVERLPKHGKATATASALRNLLKSRMARLPAADNLLLANADGQVFATAAGADNFSVADHGYFQRLLADPKKPFLISEPIRFRSTPGQGIVVAQPHLDASGHVDWVLLGDIPVAYFESHFKRVDVGRYGVISLYDTSLRVVSRVPVANNLPTGAAYASWSPSAPGPVNGTVLATSSVDNQARIYAVRDVPGYPLQLAVGIAKEDYLASWYTELQIYLLAALLLAVLAGLLLRLYFSNRRHVASLSASESENRSLVAALFEGVIMQDAQGAIVSCNDSAVGILGIARDKMLGLVATDPYWRCLREDMSPFPGDEHPSMVALRTAREVRNVVMGVYKPDGSLTWIEINAKPLFEEGRAHPVAVVSSFVDISERKGFMRRLNDAVAALNEAQRIARIGSWEWDAQSGRTIWSEQLYHMFGLDAAQPPPTSVDHPHIYTPDSWARFNSAFDHALETGQAFEVELAFFRKDGRSGWALARGEAILGAGLRVIKLRGTVQDISDQKSAEVALRLSEEKLRTTFELLPLGLSRNSMDGRFREGNRALLDMLGYTLDELCGLTYWELTPESYHGEEAEQLALLRSTGRYGPYEKEYIHRSGRRILVRLNGVLITGRDGEQFIWSTVEDISASRAAELEARQLTDRLTLATQAVGMGVWDWNVVTGEMIWNERMFTLYDFDPENPVDRMTQWRERLHPKDLILTEALLQESLETGEPYHAVYRITKLNGQQRWIRAAGLVVRDETGAALRVNGVNWDVTENIAAERAVKEAHTQLQGIIDAADTFAIIATDLTGTIKLFSKGAEHMLGYLAAEMVDATSPLSLHLPAEVAERGAELSELLGLPVQGFDVFVALARQGQTESREWTYVRKDGSTLPVNVVVSAMLDTQGKLSGFVGIAKDIREDKEALEGLAQAKERAETANRAKSEFVANMSHEIRTPMNGVIGMTELALRTALTPDQRDYLNAARDSALSLLRVINDILDFSRMEAGKFELAPREFVLRDLLGAIIRGFGPAVHAKGLELSLAVAPEIPGIVVGDPERLRQVLVNLIGNAEKFTSRGEIFVSVTQGSSDAEGVTLYFAVRDTGIGIPEAKRQSVFEAFSQADGSITRQYGGSGLGLTICRKIVKLMRGRIWVTSEVGVGSVFQFTARLARGDDTQDQGNGLVALGGKRVLVIDDNANNRRILAEMLGSWGMVVVARASGTAGLASLQEAAELDIRYNLVIIDERMPDMDGFAVAESIRNHVSYSAPMMAPLLMMLSSDNRGAATARCTALGIARHIHKPIIEADLFDAIQGVLAVDAPVLAAAAPAALQVNRPSSKLDVLVAEDNPINQKLASIILQAHGHSVTVARNGREALDVLSRRDFDVILMDVQMPEMDGYTATMAIREREAVTGRHTRIVALTAYAMERDRLRAMEAGMDAHLTKPYEPEDLIAAVEAADLQQPAAAPGGGAAQSHAPFDLSVTLSRAMGNMAVVGELTQIFMADAPDALAEIQQAINDQDGDKARRAAHRLKGAAAYFGAAPAVVAVVALENACEAGLMDEMHIAYQNLDHEVERLLAAFRQVSEGSPP